MVGIALKDIVYRVDLIPLYPAVRCTTVSLDLPVIHVYFALTLNRTEHCAQREGEVDICPAYDHTSY